ncbi:MAG: ATP-binding cassette domain-containing protein [Staphylococcus warneri]|uniref:ABC transporter ATP-binding protein n=1 Tax=Staphylococcus warneri TaxID=1292 RepID=UPI0004DFB5EC|nr:ATP-binding cassette domain-containing protein [Staphylococcus warneri]MBS6090565.1 ATP-binding cassette domain-containing protein [Staphylococcus warneri]MDU1528632.1 ATP-binding cassette domain-containing protein [Staphylococcus warneri]MDU2355682.1 ATP-binding cassette domain-containing protein [Staphylococcus warneri]MDU2986440.1 ATP-binding cassette domain-containing protein [Staphylococcus warneri]MDU3507911.1 ATP-binding cassette domain-containing protein [Staphylococcus warneri]
MLLEIEHLTYEADHRTILKDINFKVDKGDTIAIIGPSGSGKSTLLKQLNHLIEPTLDTLYLNGKPYHDYTPESIRMKVSYLMQQSEMIGTTIEDNMKFPSEARNQAFDKDKALNLLEKVGLGDYDLSAEIEHMSGGEKQRITIARQLMFEPEVLLLDESTSALDTHNKERVEDIIFKMAEEGIAILWITHSDDQSMRHFQKRMTIIDGEIAKIEELNQHE